MLDERAFIARLDSANAEEMARMLMRPSADEEKALRLHLGDRSYERLHRMALKRSVTRGKAKGNVVVIHGIMGAELSTVNRKGALEQVWVKVFRLARGWIDRLRLQADGITPYNPDYDARATGIMKRYYGDILLSLSQNWNTRAFWFDWRKDLKFSADELHTQINSWFGKDAPVHIVAHSMGGLVARTFIKKYANRWKTMWDADTKGKSGGRLIMLGTPNHGSFVVPQFITGLEGVVKKLEFCDIRHNLSELLTIMNSFVGSYQMLPSPFLMKKMEPLYKSETYGNLDILQSHLDNARKHHELLRDVADPDRMTYIAGYNKPTFCDIVDWAKLDSTTAYDVTTFGDGRVPHQLGFLKTPTGREVKTYYIEEEHAGLVLNEQVLESLEDLMEIGATNKLRDKIPSKREFLNKTEARRHLLESQAKDEARLEELIPLIRVRNAEPKYLTSEEREAEAILMRGFLGYRKDYEEGKRRAPDHDMRVSKLTRGEKAWRIRISLVRGDIQNINRAINGKPVDAISVGHYVGVKPQYAEKAIDKAISCALLGKKESELEESDLVLTQYTERGIIRGELGQPFFLTDPRTKGEKNTGPFDRVIAIAGMGIPGRFGVPELTVMVRELCWSLGRMGKNHLATVLIGSGAGNLSLGQAVAGWISGIEHAIAGSVDRKSSKLEHITFVERDPGKIEEVQEAILREKERLNARLNILYEEVNEKELAYLRKEAIKIAKKRVAEEIRSRRNPSDDQTNIPTKITLELQGKTYRYGAITSDASIPVREIPLDPALVIDANDELAAEHDPNMQLERGRFMEKLLLPEDLRKNLPGKAPIVMMLDSTTARIHWEMITLTGIASTSTANDYLSIGRGFTRQLRTTFAPPPEPPPPPRRVLRVLIVADPAEDAPLMGAQREGVEVAEIFESFNKVYSDEENSIEVVRMFGPNDAKRTSVLRELMLRPFDVLHFAGHCMFDKDEPSSSGWIFTGGHRLTANELKRIDRVPKFVFSNACESGITPDRSEKRSVELAPSFAEAFFARGVANFICTAWPVGDDPARRFALKLYSGLLGLEADTPRNNTKNKEAFFKPGKFEPMHEAMKQARLSIKEAYNDSLTWGAYQHYGDPYFRFFERVTAGRGLKPGNKDVKSTPGTKTRKKRQNGSSRKKKKG